MPCPHNEITIVQRSQRQSAVAAAAYQSGEKLFCEYDQQVKHYPEKRGIVHNEILLPANAPPEYADRNTLWNAAEAVEKQWNSQLARRWVLTIPREIPPDQYAVLPERYRALPHYDDEAGGSEQPMKTDVIINRDALCALQELPSESVHCCVTSPPYFALRDYGLDAQIGQEDTPEQYIDRLTSVFRELYRVLRKDGTLWLNIADTYCGTGNKGGYADPKNPKGRTGQRIARNSRVTGCKQKDLIGIPWLLAFSLREQGWYLRSDIIWQKQNPMPESCKDRPTRCYEHIFLLSKEKKYYYDAAAIAEPLAPTTAERYRRARSTNSKYTQEIPGQGKVQGLNRPRDGGYYDDALMPTTRNKRDVWLINTVPYKGAHFAAFPPKLAETCILAGCPKGGIVIDPFFGSGTTGFAAKSLDRHYIGIELNAEYCALARARIGGAGLSSN